MWFNSSVRMRPTSTCLLPGLHMQIRTKIFPFTYRHRGDRGILVSVGRGEPPLKTQKSIALIKYAHSAACGCAAASNSLALNYAPIERAGVFTRRPTGLDVHDQLQLEMPTANAMLVKRSSRRRRFP